ncbi:MAG: energy-coupling factor transporter ATPase [Ruminococcaceae bacterium]|nr:energy-coupling factor transporter ATPase [Oscillospiraceae bacterium]MBQ1259566.1 energy-coupling factor transporter ATPase [Clostridia bacterium]
MDFLKTDNVYFSYEDDEQNSRALNGVTLSVKKGEYVAIIGHNGSGKSTLAKLFNLILDPTEGSVYYLGKNYSSDDITDEDVYELRANVGMVFQNPDNQIVATVVEEDVAFGMENLGVPTKEMHIRVKEALESVGMSEYAKKEPASLSGGQKQRVAIAGILAMKPSCIILDESTAMLDPIGRKDVIDTVERLNREEGITVITITHYMNEAARADRVVVIHDGKLILDGTPHEVFANYGLLRECRLDVPQSNALLHELKARGVEIDTDSITPNEVAEKILALYRKKHGGSLNG